jgi:hypothetical protein
MRWEFSLSPNSRARCHYTDSNISLILGPTLLMTTGIESPCEQQDCVLNIGKLKLKYLLIYSGTYLTITSPRPQNYNFNILCYWHGHTAYPLCSSQLRHFLIYIYIYIYICIYIYIHTRIYMYINTYKLSVTERCGQILDTNSTYQNNKNIHIRVWKQWICVKAERVYIYIYIYI